MILVMRRIALALAILCSVLLLASCAEATEIELPPIPTYSDSTPSPVPSLTPSPSPMPTVKPSAAPIIYNTPEPVNAVPSPVPTVETNVPIINISDATLPEDMVQYNVATLHGHVNTDKGNIIRVEAQLLDENADVVQECHFTPYQVSFSLAGTVNAQLRFAELSPGTYTYVLAAEAENEGIKTSKELINHSFTIFSTYEEMKAATSPAEEQPSAITQEHSDAGRIWNFLVVYLDNPYGAAGIMGNIDVESQFYPQRVQGDLSTDFAFSQMYTEQVDSGQISKYSFVNAIAAEGYGSGYGLCQWSFERKEGLYDLAQERECSVGDLDTQCIYLVMELEMKYPELLKLLKTTDDAREAAREFFYVFEQGAVMGSRADLAEEYFEKFA